MRRCVQRDFYGVAATAIAAGDWRTCDVSMYIGEIAAINYRHIDVHLAIYVDSVQLLAVDMNIITAIIIIIIIISSSSNNSRPYQHHNSMELAYGLSQL